MKFITEADLRDLYRKEQFTAYQLEDNAKLTPGGRQFLADIGVKLDDKAAKGKQKQQESKHVAPAREEWKIKQLHGRMKSVEALFLLTIEELLTRNAEIAQSAVQLKVHYSQIYKAVKNNLQPEGLICRECSGIKEANFSDNLGDCFEISEFHMLLKNGRELLILHRLRCELQEIEPAAQELCGSSEEERLLLAETTRKVNQIINSISQLICSMAGGETCQRKN